MFGKEQTLNLMHLLESTLVEDYVALTSLVETTKLCNSFKNVLANDNTVVEDLHGNFLIVGDLHGNFVDLIYIVKKYGMPRKDFSYIFLGDYVDRGLQSIETYMYLMCLKILFPNNIILLRGNHEFEKLTSVYGFLEECKEMMGDVEGRIFYDLLVSTFPYLPLAAILPNRIFACHGGISSHINKIADLRNICRYEITKFTDNKIVCDLVWGDPRNFNDISPTRPSQRGLGEEFSLKKTKEFLENNNLSSIIRAHEACDEGFEQSQVDEKGTLLCLTVFSSSNYCDDRNMGAVALLEDNGNIVLDTFSNSFYEQSEDEFDEKDLQLTALYPVEAVGYVY